MVPKRNITRSQIMRKVTLEIDEHTEIILRDARSKDKQTHEVLENTPKTEQILREIQTFMMNGLQYCKAKEAYWIITPQDTTQKIGRSKYYNDRKKSDYVVQ